MHTTTNTSMNVGATGGIDLGPTQSVQLMFALLQLQLAEDAKGSAIEKMNGIADTQQRQKEMTDVMHRVQDYLDSDEQKDKDPLTIDSGLVHDIEQLGYGDMIPSMKWIGDVDEYQVSRSDLEKLVSRIQDDLNTVGTDTQQQMIYVQDFMGQYNAYLQGANSQIATNNQTLTALARGQ